MWTAENIGNLFALSIFAFVSLSLFSYQRECVVLTTQAEHRAARKKAAAAAEAAAQAQFQAGDVETVSPDQPMDVKVVDPAKPSKAPVGLAGVGHSSGKPEAKKTAGPNLKPAH